jgi:hypothetical protein
MIAEKRAAVRLADPDRASLRLRVLLLPLQEGSTGPGEEADLASLVHHLPLLSGVVEFDFPSLTDFGFLLGKIAAVMPERSYQQRFALVA